MVSPTWACGCVLSKGSLSWGISDSHTVFMSLKFPQADVTSDPMLTVKTQACLQSQLGLLKILRGSFVAPPTFPDQMAGSGDLSDSMCQ